MQIQNEDYNPFLIGLIRHKLGRKKGKKRKFKHVLRDHFTPLPALMHRRRKERKKAQRAQRAQAARNRKIVKRPTIYSGIKKSPTIAKSKVSPLKTMNTTKTQEPKTSQPQEQSLFTTKNVLIFGGIVGGLIGSAIIISKIANNEHTSQ